MSDLLARPGDVLSFGPFALVVRERLLTKDGVALELGARTLDTLIALVSRPNTPLSKRELMAEVWPDVTVGEGSLRFHIASLRKALGDGRDGARYIATLGGRGYCFVAPLHRSGPPGSPPSLGGDFPSTNVPSRVARMVGRSDGVLILSRQLVVERFVTIVGAGGVGKTTVAVAVGHELIEAFAGAVLFVDLGALSDPSLVASSIATMLGFSTDADDSASVLVGYLRDKRVLLILDNCEHLMAAAAELTERIYASAPQVYILATSREVLRVEGEHVYRLEPLAYPPEGVALTAADALAYPAIQLFVERAAASGARLELNDEEAAIAAGICRRVDGVALAIELAAGRVGAYGLRQTAALLEERLSLLWLGQRTAPPRQQTLKATLDWSYGLLSDVEQRVLRCLAIFIGSFTLEAARAVLASATLDDVLVLGAIDSLVAKSMVVTQGIGADLRYRLLDTTRTYALELTADQAELVGLSDRHAAYYQRWLEETGSRSPPVATATERELNLADLANVRAALEWCFGPQGRPVRGVALTAAAAPVFWAKSLHAEGHRWSERAVLALDDSTRGGEEEMHLQAFLGMSLMFDRGEIDAANIALNRSLALAEAHGDTVQQLQLLVPIIAFLTRVQDFGGALAHARRASIAAAASQDSAAAGLAHTLLGMALHFVGDLPAARQELETGMQRPSGILAPSQIYLGAGHELWAGSVLARTLWLQGEPLQAVERARRTIQAASEMDAYLTLVLSWGITVFLWASELTSAEEHINWFIARQQSEPLSLAMGRGYRGQLDVRLGDASSGVEGMDVCRAALSHGRHEMLTDLDLSRIEGLRALGRYLEAEVLVDDTIASVETNGDQCFMPELLRLKGRLLLERPNSDMAAAETCFNQSIVLSRSLGAAAWTLRAATDLASLAANQGRPEHARAVLEPVFNGFGEGFETPDLRAAQHLLASLP